MTTHAFFQSAASNVSRAAAAALATFAIASALLLPEPAQAQEIVPVAPARVVLPATGSGPALWVVRDADSTLYLFGTIHVLRPTTAWGSAKVDAAFSSASDIYFEISNPDDQAAIVPLIQQYGVSPQTPLSSLLTPGEIADLDMAAKTIGASAAQLDSLRPWLAGLSLSMAPLIKAGYDPASGVEPTLKARAEAAGKPIHGFETIDEQVQVLATLSEADQLQFLRSTLESYDDAATELDTLVEAWAAGDVATIQHLGVDELKTEAPAIYEALLTRRNAGFADDIQGLLTGSGTAFIAVGAAHLTGPDSVQAMLAARGVTVEQQ
ncbi:TraB/GumN family protein [soil metagenome]